MYHSALFPDKSVDYKSLERELHASSFGLYPEYYPLTHTAAFVRKFPEAFVTMLVDNPDFAGYLSGINKEERIDIHGQEITLDWVKAELKHRPLILFVDMSHLQGGGVAHMQHFVYVLSDQEGMTEVADPAFGRIRALTDKELRDGIMGLKYQMLWSPIALSVQNSTVI